MKFYNGTSKLTVYFIFTAILSLIFICGQNTAAQPVVIETLRMKTQKKPLPKKPTTKVTVEPETIERSAKTTTLLVFTNPLATVTIKPADKTSPPVSKKVPEAKYVEFENLRAGKYIVTASRSDLVSQETEVIVPSRQKIAISLELEEPTYDFKIKTNIQSGEVRYAPARLIKKNPDGTLTAAETGAYIIAPIKNGVASLSGLRSGYFRIDIRPEDYNSHLPFQEVVQIPDDIWSETVNVELALKEKPKTAENVADSNKAVPKIDFGNYHALVIGNNEYQNSIRKLKNAVNDAQAVEAVLREKYGFKTKLLLNATGKEIIAAINAYKRTLSENDNLLVFYSGHGVKDADEAYWIPIDATDAEDNTTWVSSTVHIIKNFKNTKARHILVISDSCFSGAIDLRELTVVEAKATTERERYLRTLVENKSRVLIASGGDEPVLDTGGGNNSIFTKALLNGLEKMDEPVFTAAELFRRFIEQQVSGNAEQTPELKTLRDSGHEKGYFVFVRKR